MDIPQPQHYFVKLLATRDGFAENMTAEEERIMEEHFAYLKELVAKKKVLLAGPVFNSVFGMVILEVYSEAEALEIMSKEPSVTQGVLTYKMSPMRASLMADNVSAERYVADESDKVLIKEVTVTASLEDVWQAWTTTEGVTTFFSSQAKVELRPGGPYEIYFLLDNPYGLKGSEDCKILSYLPQKMLAFEWNAPPDFGMLRYIKTRVILNFDEVEPGRVKVVMSHVGWGKSEEWDKLFEYFDNAWGYVLANFEKQFSGGPID
ncbi:MAG: hypothetical protein GY839_09905 [candidate division Zixibacteria bacterium]|nr:hypothetical protein [candidate division Zixibacteria bacterium]